MPGIRDLEDAPLGVIENENLEIAVGVISAIFRLFSGDVTV